MKRWFGVLVVACVAGAAVAQAPFTIVRPADGSKVREKVHILIPKNSIPDGGYIGIFLNGKFMEATVPPLNGKNYDYVLDTKGKGIPDGPATLEAVLYVDYKENPRIVDRTSVNVTVGNHANIPVPAGGMNLRYRYVPGTQTIYSITQTVAVSTINENQNRLGGHPAEIVKEEEKYRIAYAVDNAYGNGDGLVRIQPLPPKGKTATFVTTAKNPDGAEFEAWQMAPVYMKLSSTGKQLFGSVPDFISSEYFTNSGAAPVDFITPDALPLLPSKPVKVGSKWQTSFQLPQFDDSRKHLLNSLVLDFPMRGELVDFEWESGHPCAKIRHTMDMGTRSKQGRQLEALNRSFSDEKLGLEETIWFALDKRQVLKVIRSVTIDEKVETSNAGFGGPGGAPGGAPAGTGGPRGLGPAGTGGGGVGGDLLNRGAGGQGKAGSLRPGGTGGGPAGTGQGAPGRSGGGGATGTQYIRLRQQQVFLLEQ